MVQVRLASADDYPGMVRLARQLQDEHVAALPLIFKLDGHNLSTDRFAALLEDPFSAVYVADLDDRIVASAVVVAQSLESSNRLVRASRGNRSESHHPSGSSPVAGADRRERPTHRRLSRARIKAILRRSPLLRAVNERLRGSARGESAIQRKRAVAVLESVVVDHAHRGAGIGRSLVGEVRQWAEERGAEYLELTVWEFNTGAIALYKSLGFDTLSRTMSVQLGDASPPPASS
jgi:ribosomal protein S18 acetylase RimI-like enzyme